MTSRRCSKIDVNAAENPYKRARTMNIHTPPVTANAVDNLRAQVRELEQKLADEIKSRREIERKFEESKDTQKAIENKYLVDATCTVCHEVDHIPLNVGGCGHCLCHKCALLICGENTVRWVIREDRGAWDG